MSSTEQESMQNAQTPAQKKKRGKLKKKHIKWFVLGGIVLAVAALIVILSNRYQSALSTVAYADTTVLAYGDMENSISTTGTVESAESHSVYSTMAYTVAEVMVEIGDAVQPGDVLCQLDAQALRRQIEQSELTMTNAEKAAAQSIKSARDSYNNLKEGVEQGVNQSLIAADSSVQNAYNAYRNAQIAYDEFATSLRRGQNSTLLQLGSAMDSTAQAYQAASDAYNAAKSARDAAKTAFDQAQASTVGMNQATAEAAVTKAQTDVYNAQAALDVAQREYDEAIAPGSLATATQISPFLATLNLRTTALAKAQGVLTKAQQDLAMVTTKGANTALQTALTAAQTKLDSAASALRSAEAAYDNARVSYRAAQNNANSTLDSYARNIDSALQAYETALQSATATEVTVDDQLEVYKNQLESTMISVNTDSSEYQLAMLYEDLEDTTVRAEHAGTVTAVYAKVGSPGSGLLFVIENTEDLIVDTTVKSYDVGVVREGMRVTIKSDATGDALYEGSITSIAPTSNKNAMGMTDRTGDAVFATEVAVKSKDTGLRIGMSARLNYIIDAQTHVLSVPYDAVYENAAGESCVLALIEGTKGRYLIVEYPVTTGIENDLDVAITGTDITEGVRVINQPTTYQVLLGQEVVLADQSLLALAGAALPLAN